MNLIKDDTIVINDFLINKLRLMINHKSAQNRFKTVFGSKTISKTVFGKNKFQEPFQKTSSNDLWSLVTNGLCYDYRLTMWISASKFLTHLVVSANLGFRGWCSKGWCCEWLQATTEGLCRNLQPCQFNCCGLLLMNQMYRTQNGNGLLECCWTHLPPNFMSLPGRLNSCS